jgi:hypothetical protein
MDFGIARLMDTEGGQTRTIVGTPAYMSPEQAAGNPLDARTDVYALGLIFYEMVTGQRTFSGDTPVVLALKHVRETPRPPHEHAPSISRRLEAAILKCLEKDPANRFQSVSELQAGLGTEAEESSAELATPCVALALSSVANEPAGADLTRAHQLAVHQLVGRAREFANSLAILARSWKSAATKWIERSTNDLIDKSSFNGRRDARQMLLSGCGVLLLTGFSLACVAVRFRELTTSSHAAMLDAHSGAKHSLVQSSLARAPISEVPPVTAPTRVELPTDVGMKDVDDESHDAAVGAGNDKVVARITKKAVKSRQSKIALLAASSLGSVSSRPLTANRTMPYMSLPVPNTAADAQLDASSRAEELARDNATKDLDGSTASADTTASGGFLEVGNFKELSWAQRAADSLEALGFHVSILHKGHLWTNSYHVVVGPYTDAEASSAARTKLESQGFKVRFTK